MNQDSDQTTFTAHQEVLQAPPAPAPSSSPLPVQPSHKKRNLLIGLCLVTTLLLGLTFFINQSPQREPLNSVLKFDTKTTSRQTDLGQRFQTLKTQITDSDPTKQGLAPPPVDYQITLIEDR